MAVDFCDYFWGEEHNGWNVLYQNMKQGHSASKELAEFIKERGSIDETYCKALYKLANKVNINTEKGTLAPIFTLLKISSEKMSSIHLHMVNKIQDLVKDILKYNEDLHKKQKNVKDEESQTEDIVKSIQATSGLAQKAKETYSQRCQDFEKLKRDGASPKDVEKAETKLRKSHDEYKLLIEKYNNIRDEFEKRMIQSCKRFQSVEESHLKQIMNFVQNYIGVLQDDKKAMAQILEELEYKYQQLNIEKLLDNFVLTKLTGLEKPVMMVFEDTCSLGSAVSGQQSPEPSIDHCKPTGEETNSLGGGDKVISTGVLTGGRVCGGGNMGVAKSKSSRGRSSIFTLSRGTRGCKDNSLMLSTEGEGGSQGPLHSLSASSVGASSSSSSSSSCNPSQSVRSSRVSRPVTYRKPDPKKDGRRTTSLLNIFAASNSVHGNEREWSAPPQLKSDVDENDVERLENEAKVVSHWPLTSGSLPTSPTKGGSSPTSPNEEDSTISRSLFRSSKWFLRSRKDKKKDKKLKKKKENDSSSNKDDKSDNENSEEAKTADLISVGGPKDETLEVDEKNTDNEEIEAGTIGSGSGCGQEDTIGILGSDVDTEEARVDEDGYTIRPSPKAPLNRENSFDSSSDSDSEIGIEKKIHVEIKPITNGVPPISASVDELRATIEGMSLSPLGFSSSKKSAEGQESMKRSNSITQQIGGSNSSDLLGLSLHLNANASASPKFGMKEPSQDGSGGSNGTGNLNQSIPSSTKEGFPILSSTLSQSNMSPNPMSQPQPSKHDRYAELSEILGDASSTDSVPPSLPPRGTSSRGSTPTPTMAIPRPSRKFENSRSVQSPATISAALSRTESVSSLEFRTSSVPTGLSRGPSPLTIGMADTIPLAVAFQELCHAYFRGTDESRVQIKVTGEMMVSFPAGIVGVLANNPSPSQLSFKVQNFNKMLNPLPNKQLISFDESQSTVECGVYNFNMSSLGSLLRRQADENPSASYFNVDIIKYQVSCSKGVSSCPLHMVSYWRCEGDHTDLKVDYKYNERAMSAPCSLLNITISVPVDGVVRNMHSKPVGQWLKDQQKAVWKITELSQHSSEGGKGSLRGKFEVAAGPSTPATVSAQFNCEGTTLSGLEFGLIGAGYRVSLIKKRFVSGKYICDADAVLKLKYGVVPS